MVDDDDDDDDDNNNNNNNNNNNYFYLPTAVQCVSGLLPGGKVTGASH
jgi:hypothetical protein